MRFSRGLGWVLSLSVVGCGGGNGCPNGFEPVMGMCVEAGARPDAGLVAADAASVVQDAWLAPGADAGAEVVDAASTSDAASAPDAGCPYPTLYVDDDGDGYGDPTHPVADCVEARAGHVRDATDCDDACASCRPGGTETCNGADDDCDGAVDDGVTSSFYVDADGDGFGVGAAVTACAAPAGHSAAAGDCDDACASCRPGGTETCNGADDDCDGAVDDGVMTTFFRDADGDTYGRDDVTVQACTQPGGHAVRGGDCDDASSTASPGTAEVCDGRDNDCDGAIDDGVMATFHLDADGDAYGRADMTRQACVAPSGYVARAGDCNDAAFAIRPDATETCNDIDDDCDGAVDDGLATATYYADCDRDGYTSSRQVVSGCHAPALAPECGPEFTGFWRTTLSSPPDCADFDARAFPGQTAFFSLPIRGYTEAPYHDFNCDGRMTQELTTVVTSCGGGGTCARRGWAGSVPECGRSDDLLTCGYNASFVCAASIVMANQACR